jgi:protocatechuate 3,4-dioxygenase beta subunit
MVTFFHRRDGLVPEVGALTSSSGSSNHGIVKSSVSPMAAIGVLSVSWHIMFLTFDEREAMIRAIDENTITDAVIEQMSQTADERLKEIMNIAVRHLHSFAREANLAPDEWIEGIRFLTATGHMCTEYRQEFILLSDTLGLSSLVNSLHDKRSIQESTKSSLLGPFYRKDSPVLQLGDSIAENCAGEKIGVYGRVIDRNEHGIAKASIEVWQPDDEGYYDLQKQDPSQMELRGRFYTDEDGRYHFRTIKPVGYKIPMDGPVGEMVRAQGRHGWRPAHIHFLVSAPQYREAITALYMADDEHIDSDTVFGANESLITLPKANDLSSPFSALPSLHFDFTLASADAATSGRVGADPSEIVQRAEAH